MRGSELRHLLILLALLATPALADWKQDYARGLEAAKDGRWVDVDRHMQAALADEENKGRLECSSLLVRQGQPAKSDTPASPPAQPARTEPVPARPEPPPSRPIVQAPPPARPSAGESRESSSVSAQILRPLLDAYLGGRYADVLKLSSQVPPTSRLRWHMLILRAAAAFNLSQLGQMPDADGIARKAVEQARETDASMKPDADYFSPKFIRYYNSR